MTHLLPIIQEKKHLFTEWYVIWKAALWKKKISFKNNFWVAKHLLSRPLYFPLLFHFLMTDNLADWLFRWGRSRGSHRCCWAPLGGALSSTEWTWHFGSVHWAMQTSLDMGDSELICRSPHTSPCILVMSKMLKEILKPPILLPLGLEKDAKMEDRTNPSLNLSNIMKHIHYNLWNPI